MSTTTEFVDGFDLQYGTRVLGDHGYGTVTEARSAGMLRVEWENTPAAYDSILKDRIGSSEWDLLENSIVRLEVV